MGKSSAKTSTENLNSPKSMTVVVTPRTQGTDNDYNFTSVAKKNNKREEDVSTPALKPFGSLESGDTESTGTLGFDEFNEDFDVEGGHAMIPVLQLK